MELLSLLVTLGGCWVFAEILVGDGWFKPNTLENSANVFRLEDVKRRERNVHLNVVKRIMFFLLSALIVWLLPIPRDYRLYHAFAFMFFLMQGAVRLLWYTLVVYVPDVRAKWFSATFDEQGDFRR